MYGQQPFLHPPPPLPPLYPPPGLPIQPYYNFPPPPITNWYQPPLYSPVQNSFGYHQPQFLRGRGQRPRGSRGAPHRKPVHSQIIPCHACNREYKSDETYQAHIQTHIKCDQCDFTALPKIVREHSVVHSLPDFLTFSTPEDTQSWRNERRKHYPTVANVVKKKQQETDKKERRQVLNTPLHRYVSQLIGESEHSRSRGRGRGRGWKRGSGRSWQPHRQRSISDELSKEQVDEEGEVEEPILNERKRSTNNTTEKELRKKRVKSNDVFPWKPTLLEKLLCNEIRSEHNAILQCVHYIVNNNFWDKDGIISA